MPTQDGSLGEVPRSIPPRARSSLLPPSRPASPTSHPRRPSREDYHHPPPHPPPPAPSALASPRRSSRPILPPPCAPLDPASPHGQAQLHGHRHPSSYGDHSSRPPPPAYHYRLPSLCQATPSSSPFLPHPASPPPAQPFRPQALPPHHLPSEEAPRRVAGFKRKSSSSPSPDGHPDPQLVALPPILRPAGRFPPSSASLPLHSLPARESYDPQSYPHPHSYHHYHHHHHQQQQQQQPRSHSLQVSKASPSDPPEALPPSLAGLLSTGSPGRLPPRRALPSDSPHLAVVETSPGPTRDPTRTQPRPPAQPSPLPSALPHPRPSPTCVYPTPMGPPASPQQDGPPSSLARPGHLAHPPQMSRYSIPQGDSFTVSHRPAGGRPSTPLLVHQPPPAQPPGAYAPRPRAEHPYPASPAEPAPPRLPASYYHPPVYRAAHRPHPPALNPPYHTPHHPHHPAHAHDHRAQPHPVSTHLPAAPPRHPSPPPAHAARLPAHPSSPYDPPSRHPAPLRAHAREPSARLSPSSTAHPSHRQHPSRPSTSSSSLDPPMPSAWVPQQPVRHPPRLDSPSSTTPSDQPRLYQPEPRRVPLSSELQLQLSPRYQHPERPASSTNPQALGESSIPNGLIHPHPSTHSVDDRYSSSPRLADRYSEPADAASLAHPRHSSSHSIDLPHPPQYPRQSRLQSTERFQRLGPPFYEPDSLLQSISPRERPSEHAIPYRPRERSPSPAAAQLHPADPNLRSSQQSQVTVQDQQDSFPRHSKVRRIESASQKMPYPTAPPVESCSNGPSSFASPAHLQSVHRGRLPHARRDVSSTHQDTSDDSTYGLSHQKIHEPFTKRSNGPGKADDSQGSLVDGTSPLPLGSRSPSANLALRDIDQSPGNQFDQVELKFEEPFKSSQPSSEPQRVRAEGSLGIHHLPSSSNSNSPPKKCDTFMSRLKSPPPLSSLHVALDHDERNKMAQDLSSPTSRPPAIDSIQANDDDDGDTSRVASCTEDEPFDDLADDGIIRCICSISTDDGFTIQCETCEVWQHAVCVNVPIDEVPEHYFCDRCDPSPERRRQLMEMAPQAERIQRRRLKKEADVRHPRRVEEISSAHQVPTSSSNPTGLSEQDQSSNDSPPVSTAMSRVSSGAALNESNQTEGAGPSPSGHSRGKLKGSHSSVPLDKLQVTVNADNGLGLSGLQDSPTSMVGSRSDDFAFLRESAPRKPGRKPTKSNQAKQNSLKHSVEHPLSCVTGNHALESDLAQNLADPDDRYEPWRFEYTPTQKDLYLDAQVRSQVQQLIKQYLRIQSSNEDEPGGGLDPETQAQDGVPGEKRTLPVDQVLSTGTEPTKSPVGSLSQPGSAQALPSDTNAKPQRPAPYSFGNTYFVPVTMSELPSPVKLTIKPIPPSAINLFPSLSTNPFCPNFSNSLGNASTSSLPRFITHGVFSAQPIPRGSYIASLKGSITSVKKYTQDLYNQYGSLGCNKPYVKFFKSTRLALLHESEFGQIGDGLVIDSRQYGNEMRFIRSGCHPNAFINIVMTPQVPSPSHHELSDTLHYSRVQALPSSTSPCISSVSARNHDSNSTADISSTIDTLMDRDLHLPWEVSFGVFAANDISRREEIILPWDWDDQHLVHLLPRLLNHSSTFEAQHQQRSPTLPPVRIQFLPWSMSDLNLLSCKLASVALTIFGLMFCGCERKKSCAVNLMWKVGCLSAGRPMFPIDQGVVPQDVTREIVSISTLKERHDLNLPLTFEERLRVVLYTFLEQPNQFATKAGRSVSLINNPPTHTRLKKQKVDLGPLLGLQRDWWSYVRLPPAQAEDSFNTKPALRKPKRPRSRSFFNRHSSTHKLRRVSDSEIRKASSSVTVDGSVPIESSLSNLECNPASVSLPDDSAPTETTHLAVDPTGQSNLESGFVPLPPSLPNEIETKSLDERNLAQSPVLSSDPSKDLPSDLSAWPNLKDPHESDPQAGCSIPITASDEDCDRGRRSDYDVSDDLRPAIASIVGASPANEHARRSKCQTVESKDVVTIEATNIAHRHIDLSVGAFNRDDSGPLGLAGAGLEVMKALEPCQQMPQTADGIDHADPARIESLPHISNAPEAAETHDGRTSFDDDTCEQPAQTQDTASPLIPSGPDHQASELETQTASSGACSFNAVLVGLPDAEAETVSDQAKGIATIPEGEPSTKTEFQDVDFNRETTPMVSTIQPRASSQSQASPVPSGQVTETAPKEQPPDTFQILNNLTAEGSSPALEAQLAGRSEVQPDPIPIKPRSETYTPAPQSPPQALALRSPVRRTSSGGPTAELIPDLTSQQVDVNMHDAFDEGPVEAIVGDGVRSHIIIEPAHGQSDLMNSAPGHEAVVTQASNNVDQPQVSIPHKHQPEENAVAQVASETNPLDQNAEERKLDRSLSEEDSRGSIESQLSPIVSKTIEQATIHSPSMRSRKSASISDRSESVVREDESILSQSSDESEDKFLDSDASTTILGSSDEEMLSSHTPRYLNNRKRIRSKNLIKPPPRAGSTAVNKNQKMSSPQLERPGSLATNGMPPLIKPDPRRPEKLVRLPTARKKELDNNTTSDASSDLDSAEGSARACSPKRAIKEPASKMRLKIQSSSPPHDEVNEGPLATNQESLTRITPVSRSFPLVLDQPPKPLMDTDRTPVVSVPTPLCLQADKPDIVPGLMPESNVDLSSRGSSDPFGADHLQPSNACRSIIETNVEPTESVELENPPALESNPVTAATSDIVGPKFIDSNDATSVPTEEMLRIEDPDVIQSSSDVLPQSDNDRFCPLPELDHLPDVAFKDNAGSEGSTEAIEVEITKAAPKRISLKDYRSRKVSESVAMTPITNPLILPPGRSSPSVSSSEEPLKKQPPPPPPPIIPLLPPLLPSAPQNQPLLPLSPRKLELVASVLKKEDKDRTPLKAGEANATRNPAESETAINGLTFATSNPSSSALIGSASREPEEDPIAPADPMSSMPISKNESSRASELRNEPRLATEDKGCPSSSTAQVMNLKLEYNEERLEGPSEDDIDGVAIESVSTPSDGGLDDEDHHQVEAGPSRTDDVPKDLNVKFTPPLSTDDQTDQSSKLGACVKLSVLEEGPEPVGSVDGIDGACNRASTPLVTPDPPSSLSLNVSRVPLNVESVSDHQDDSMASQENHEQADPSEDVSRVKEVDSDESPDCTSQVPVIPKPRLSLAAYRQRLAAARSSAADESHRPQSVSPGPPGTDISKIFPDSSSIPCSVPQSTALDLRTVHQDSESSQKDLVILQAAPDQSLHSSSSTDSSLLVTHSKLEKPQNQGNLSGSDPTATSGDVFDSRLSQATMYFPPISPSILMASEDPPSPTSKSSRSSSPSTPDEATNTQASRLGILSSPRQTSPHPAPSQATAGCPPNSSLTVDPPDVITARQKNSLIPPVLTEVASKQSSTQVSDHEVLGQARSPNPQSLILTVSLHPSSPSTGQLSASLGKAHVSEPARLDHSTSSPSVHTPSLPIPIPPQPAFSQARKLTHLSSAGPPSLLPTPIAHSNALSPRVHPPSERSLSGLRMDQPIPSLPSSRLMPTSSNQRSPVMTPSPRTYNSSMSPSPSVPVGMAETRSSPSEASNHGMGPSRAGGVPPRGLRPAQAFNTSSTSRAPWPVESASTNRMDSEYFRQGPPSGLMNHPIPIPKPNLEIPLNSSLPMTPTHVTGPPRNSNYHFPTHHGAFFPPMRNFSDHRPTPVPIMGTSGPGPPASFRELSNNGNIERARYDGIHRGPLPTPSTTYPNRGRAKVRGTGQPYWSLDNGGGGGGSAGRGFGGPRNES